MLPLRVMDQTPVLYDVADAIATITLNRPENRNSMTPDVMSAFRAAVARAAADRALRCVVVTGRGTSFCAGADFRGASPAEAHATEEVPDYERLFRTYEPFLEVFDLPMPTIAAMNGHAVGGGFGLALVCDLRVANRDARYGANFAKLGFHSGMAISHLLPRIVGVPVAAEMLFTGKLVSGAEAASIGLAHEAVAADDGAGRCDEARKGRRCVRARSGAADEAVALSRRGLGSAQRGARRGVRAGGDDPQRRCARGNPGAARETRAALHRQVNQKTPGSAFRMCNHGRHADRTPRSRMRRRRARGGTAGRADSRRAGAARTVGLQLSVVVGARWAGTVRSRGRGPLGDLPPQPGAPAPGGATRIACTRRSRRRSLSARTGTRGAHRGGTRGPAARRRPAGPAGRLLLRRVRRPSVAADLRRRARRARRRPAEGGLRRAAADRGDRPALPPGLLPPAHRRLRLAARVLGVGRSRAVARSGGHRQDGRPLLVSVPVRGARCGCRSGASTWDAFRSTCSTPTGPRTGASTAGSRRACTSATATPAGAVRAARPRRRAGAAGARDRAERVAPERGPRGSRHTGARRRRNARGAQSLRRAGRRTRAHRLHHAHAGGRGQRDLRARRTGPRASGHCGAAVHRLGQSLRAGQRRSREPRQPRRHDAVRAATGRADQRRQPPPRRNGARDVATRVRSQHARRGADRPRDQRRARPDLDGGADAGAARAPPRHGLGDTQQ